MRLGNPILPEQPDSGYLQALVKALYDYFRPLNIKVNNLALLERSVTYDPPSLMDGAGVTTTVSIPGAALSMYAQASFSNDTQGILVHAWVSAVNVVSVRLQNETGGTLDLASGTLRVKVANE